MTIPISSFQFIRQSGGKAASGACFGRRALGSFFLICALAIWPSSPFHGTAQAENADIASRRSSERLKFTDEEIAAGFFKVAFGAELQLGQKEQRIRKFDEPVRIFVDDRSKNNRTGEIASVVADIRAHVAHLDIALTEDSDDANMIVVIVQQRELAGTLRARYGKEKAKAIARTLNPVCISGIGKDETYRIRRAEVFLPGDAGDFTFLDCAYEELLQALGPINDSNSVPWTMFNDEVQMGFFDRYDQYLLNILYDPRIKPGMTKEEVRALFPEVVPDIRAKVSILAASNTISPH